MQRGGIDKIISEFNQTKDKNIVIVDFSNVQKWEESLGWKIGIKELGNLVKHFSLGKKFLRRFYYGSDYGKNEGSQTLSLWSALVLDKASMNRFEVVTKRVKYIHSQDNKYGFEKKCDLDVEMAVDLIKERDNYENIVLFSGDGDLMCAIKYLKDVYNKKCIVFGARGHLGREIFDAKKEGVVREILFADDFEYRLSQSRFKNRV
jgi:uncharacterized LabA/DUF88 family protein